MSKKKQTNNLREQDPYLQREQQKYNKPLPSREWIASVMEELGVPISLKKLAKILSIESGEVDFFERRIKAMVRDGQAYINRAGNICIADKLSLVKCRVEGHKDGFGFAVPLDNKLKQKDFVLQSKQMRELMHGDIVTVSPFGFDRKGRPECRVVETVERANTHVVARVYQEHGIYIAVPEDKRLTQQIILAPASKRLSIKAGQVVNVVITAYPHKIYPAMGEVVEVLGNYADPGMEIEIALRKHNLPYQFSAECVKASTKISPIVRKIDLKGRVDLRHLNLVTIDGEDARDFDDAVYVEKQGQNYRLVVAIADVSHYVRDGNAIDVDAYERATSVYFPRKVIPMLPEALSNGICSLMPGVERLCMVCDMLITRAGNMKSYQFYPAVMHSAARLTYTQVAKWLETDEKHELYHEIKVLEQLYKILKKKREIRGAMEFDDQETRMIFNENGKIERIEPVIRNDAHRLIEEFMLSANVCAADYLLKNHHHGLFRNHLGPTEEKLAALKEQLAFVGLALDGDENPTPKDYAKLFTQIETRQDRPLLQMMLLRSMRQAQYEPENEGHFGLAYEAYAHFTSPIRRYPDLLVHRAIKAILQGQVYEPVYNWAEMGKHCSFCERRAEDASRDVEKWLKTYYMQDKIGMVLESTVSGMSSFGLFVMLDDLYIEGMIHISELGQDYYHYRPEIMAIEGERTKVSYKIGDRLVVKVVRADLDTCRVDLLPLTSVDKNMDGKKTKTVTRKAKKPEKQGSKKAAVGQKTIAKNQKKNLKK